MKNNKEYVNINKDMSRELRMDWGNEVVYESSTCFDLEEEMENNDDLIEEVIGQAIYQDDNMREVIDYKYEIHLRTKQVLVKYTYYYR